MATAIVVGKGTGAGYAVAKLRERQLDSQRG